jgi:hypothetical protein
MRALTAAALGAALLAACTPAPTQAPPGQPAIRQLALDRLPTEPAHNEPTAPAPARPEDPADPATVALDLVVDGLAAQDLHIVDAGTSLIAASADRATVRIAVTHTPDGEATHTSIYDLDLTRTDGDRWTVVAARTVQ